MKRRGIRYIYYVLLIAFSIVIVLYFIRTLEGIKLPHSSRTSQVKSSQIKYILFWNTFFGQPDFYFGFGNSPFIEHDCPVFNCFTTNKRDLFSVDAFDAIIFHGAEYRPTKEEDFPRVRNVLQRYVYFSMESPANRPVGSNVNHFFNLTITHRLDSDIAMPYFHIADMNETTVSPSQNPIWNPPTLDSGNLKTFLEIYDRKKLPVAWFSSNCHAANQREKIISSLQKFISVDIFGACGPLKCPRTNGDECFKKLRDDYFFYLSYENSNCDDYVTEKVLNALKNDVVPVIYGGANLTRFLPPNSYIDAKDLSAEDLSKKLKFLMKNREEYVKYFWWKNHYHIGHSPSPMCKLCEMLNDQTIKPKVYSNIVEWWHGNSTHKVCR